MEISLRWTFIFTFIACIFLSGFLFMISANLVLPTQAQAAQPLVTQEIETQQVEDQSNSSEVQYMSENNSGDCTLSKGFPGKIRQWCEIITHYAEKRDLDPNLLGALILQESGGDALAYSHSGAVGLMQVMPKDGLAAKFMCPAGPCFQNRPSMSELKDPEFNVSYGSKMLKGLINRYGNTRDALKAYGPMDVGYSYSDKVLALYKRYRD